MEKLMVVNMAGSFLYPNQDPHLKAPVNTD